MDDFSGLYEKIKRDLKGFGSNPVADVGMITTLLPEFAFQLRDNNINYCRLTQDLDNKFSRGDDDPQASGLRKKSEAFLDRVYSTNPSTVECSQVRKLTFREQRGADSLLGDLRRWRQDVVPSYLSDHLDESFL